MTIKRRKTRQIIVGGVKIGGSAPVSIQSMAKTDTRDVKRTASQIKQLEKAGCQIVRVAVKDTEAVGALARIKKMINLPLVADIHFDYRLALLAMQNGADKIRLNPGNIAKPQEINAVINMAKSRRIPIRIGVNSGSAPASCSGAEGMVKLAMGYIKLFENLKFNDIIISLKASDVATTVSAYRQIASLCDYPLHLGITAAGLPEDAKIRSAVGVGALLLDGIGDTIRVSLTGDPVEEVIAAKQILEAAGVRSFGPQVISCPMCGRCQVDLVRIVEKLKRRLDASYVGRRTLDVGRRIKIAVMGCEVNGPGEAKDADIGIAAGKRSGMLFKKGKPVRKVAEKDFVKALLEEIRKI